jgi:N-acetylglucosaminyldiphosphoundecaprenol N-acetyl-beta-D-mannosaminyltransferase
MSLFASLRDWLRSFSKAFCGMTQNRASALGQNPFSDYPRRTVLGCPVDAIAIDAVVDEMRKALHGGYTIQIVPCNVDFVMKARRSQDFATVLQAADLVVPDGVPVVWAASILGTPLCGRVSGTDIVWRCAELSQRENVGVAMIGSGPGVAARAASNLRTRYPGAVLHPIATPQLIDDENSAALAEQAAALDCKFLLVALGAPRQEEWIQANVRKTSASVAIGVGSAFDIISGDRPQAPQWARHCGVEWVNRLRQEPRRLGRRYLVEDSPFVYHIAAAALSRVAARLRSASPGSKHR